MAWDPDHIDLISEYCDRWCERCPLTHRCAAFTRESDPADIELHSDAVEQAMEALRVELALPAPSSPWLDEIINAPEPTEAEQRETDRHFDACRVRVREDPLMVAASDYSIDSFTWLKLYGDATRAQAAAFAAERGDSPDSAVLRMEAEGVLDAVDVVRWDHVLIPAKLGRALQGKADDDASFDSNPAQTDWNGSAKLVMLLTERSEAGWRLIASWAPESEVATQLANTLSALRAAIERAFPLARRFVRPGFDEAPS